MRHEKLSAALAAAGAVLKRSKKHFVYGLPNGKTLTVSATPSDAHSEQNAMADLRHALGVESRPAVVNPPRERRYKPGRMEDVRWPPPTTSPLAHALTASGVQARADLLKAQEVEKELRWRIFTLEQDVADARAQVVELQQLLVVRAWFTARRIIRRLAAVNRA